MFGTTTLIFNRESAGYYQAGLWVEGSTTQIEAKGSLQPIDRRTFQVNSTLTKEVESRGMSSSDIRVFYTKTELKNTDEYNSTVGDITTIGNTPYEVILINPWVGLESNLEHYEVFLVKKRGSNK